MSLSVKILNGILPKNYWPDAKHIIVYAFSIGDRHYFRFDDPLNTPYKRALQALVYYRELDMNCDRALIRAHTEAFDNALKKPTINIDTLVELKRLNDYLKERLDLPKEPDLMYKLAAVVFFDQHEAPTSYEFKYGENKIRFWRENTDSNDFFLSKPLLELIPYLQFAGENLKEFSRMAEKQTKAHSNSLLPMLSEKQKTAFLNK